MIKFHRTWGESCSMDYPVQGDYVNVTDHPSNQGILLNADEAADLLYALDEFFRRKRKGEFKEEPEHVSQ